MTSTSIDLDSLAPLFHPRSVAVIGASSDPAKIGGLPVHYLKLHGFDGPIYPVNPKSPEIQDLPAYAAVGDIDGPVDLAILSVPGHLVEQAVTDCVAKGVRALVTFSAGFAELGDAGRAEQERIVAIARAGGIRMLGPNCLGLINFSSRMAATFHPAFVESIEPGGHIGMVSQSGAFGGLAFQMAQESGLAFSTIVTTGNEGDVEVADSLAYLAQDPDTKVVLMYMEGCRDGNKLLAALDLARQHQKPVVAIKLGRTDVGAQAAASHTAALAGTDAVYDALFRQYGVYRAHSIEEFFDIGAACAVGQLPKNDRTGLVTVSGGVGVLMADEAAARGLDVAPMPDAAQAKVKEMVPFAGVRNPVDVTGQIINDPGLLPRTLDVIVEDGDYAILGVFQGGVGRNPLQEPGITAAWKKIRASHPDVLMAVAGLYSPAFIDTMREHGVLTFREPTHAMRAVAALAHFKQTLDKPTPRLPAPPPGPALPVGTLTEVEAMRLLGDAGLPVIEQRLAATADEAVAAADALGYPVVMKIVSADILHKSDIGGVALNLSDADAVRTAFDNIMTKAAVAMPDAALEGCLVAPMAGAGVETILGVQSDPVFGPVVMFGLGGIFVEALGDVTFRVAPFGPDEAHRMIREIKAYPVLEGLRGQPPADIDALADALSRLSLFAAAHAGQLETLDLNPFLVRPRGEGAVALDAVLVTRTETH